MKKILVGRINSIKRAYFQWRYWKNVYQKMVKQMDKSHVIKENQLLPYINKPGIAFSFDDSYRVNDWYKYGKDMFGFYDVKVTFNINAHHHFENEREHTQDEIDLLLEFQANGHEIAHHGMMHRKAAVYSNEFGINKWIEDEIVSLINWLERKSHSRTKERFKKPVSFAFPHFVYDEENISSVIPKYFKIARGYLLNDNLTPFSHTGFIPSICLDNYYSANIKYVRKIMKLAKKRGRNLVITCHSILPKEVNWEDFGWGKSAVKSGTWRTTPELIKSIIEEARKNDMEFYTTAEIAGVASFIDPNLERCVRKLLSIPSKQWILISELNLIKELDISNKNISNLDGIQYFANLEKLNISNNNITDFRLIEKLPKLEKVDISDNPIKQIIDLSAVLE